MVLFSIKSKDEHDETNHLNSNTIDLTYTNASINLANCQSENDVENFGLLRSNNGKTISINFKQTKMHCNATDNHEQQCDSHLDCLSQMKQQQQKFYSWRFITCRHLNKMQLIAALLFYLLVFGIQTVIARPNADRNYNSNWQSVALTSENQVSNFKCLNLTSSPHLVCNQACFKHTIFKYLHVFTQVRKKKV